MAHVGDVCTDDSGRKYVRVPPLYEYTRKRRGVVACPEFVEKLQGTVVVAGRTGGTKHHLQFGMSAHHFSENPVQPFCVVIPQMLLPAAEVMGIRIVKGTVTVPLHERDAGIGVDDAAEGSDAEFLYFRVAQVHHILSALQMRSTVRLA